MKDRAEGKPGPITRLCVQWESGRVDPLSLRRFVNGDRFELRQYVRELSASSPQIRRVWLESADGALVYAAEQGHGHAAKGSPLA